MNIAIFTNILNPYRAAFFDRLFRIADEQKVGFKVYAMVGEKSDRPWKYDEFRRPYTVLLKAKTWHVKNVAYIHFNTGVEREIKLFRPDVVVMAGSYLQPTNILLIAKQNKYKYKTVFWSESHFAETREYGALKIYLREFLRKHIIGRVDAFWFPGKKAEEFIDHYRKSESIKIHVPNTVDNTFFGFFSASSILLSKDSFKQSDRMKILFTPSRLSKEKGIVQFCNILKSIPNDKYVWLIAGEGVQKEEIEKIIKDNRLNVLLIGFKNQDEIRSLYGICDLFVLGSVSDPNPLSSIEALWMKKPLFLSENVGNYPETVEVGINGDVFSYNDIETATQKLEKLLDSGPEWYEEAARVSYSKALSNFEIDVIARNTILKTNELIQNAI